MNRTPASPPPWSVITGKPETATRWPKFEEITEKPDTYPSAWATLSGKPSVYPTNWANVSDKPSQATRWPSWDEVTNKPATFTPASHTHSNNSGIGGPYAASSHSHSGYASSSHSHSWSTITSKPSWIGSSKPSYTASEVGAASSSHSHSMVYNRFKIKMSDDGLSDHSYFIVYVLIPWVSSLDTSGLVQYLTSPSDDFYIPCTGEYGIDFDYQRGVATGIHYRNYNFSVIGINTEGGFGGSGGHYQKITLTKLS